MDPAVGVSAPEAPPPRPKPRLRSLVNQALGALCWGLFFSVVPLDLIGLGALLWVPLLLWRELARMKKYPFLPGFIVRVVVVAAIVTAAVYAPVKSEDLRRVEGLSGTTVTLRDLSTKVRMQVPENRKSVQIVLPSTQPTFRQVAHAIERQTGLHCTFYRCGTGATVLGGGGVMGMGID